MKYLAYIASLTALASTMQAADVTIQGKAGRATITGVTSADTLILDSSVSPKYSAGGVTVNKLISTNGEAKGDVDICNTINWNSGQGITVDANTASGEFTAIDVNSWKHNLFALTIKNSASATDATVNVNFGSLLQVNSGRKHPRPIHLFRFRKGECYGGRNHYRQHYRQRQRTRRKKHGGCHLERKHFNRKIRHTQLGRKTHACGNIIKLRHD